MTVQPAEGKRAVGGEGRYKGVDEGEGANQVRVRVRKVDGVGTEGGGSGGDVICKAAEMERRRR